MEANTNFNALLKTLEGKTITTLTAGGDNGAIIELEFGPAYAMTIHCAWRLSRYDKVAGTWNDDELVELPEDEDEEIVNLTIKRIENCSIDSIVVGDFFDLRINIGKGYRLDVFCDLLSGEESTEWDENWSVSDIDNNICYVVTENYKVIETKYNTEVPF